MYVPKKAGEKLEDAKQWLSYAYKARSKEGVQGSIYSSSRKKAKKAEAEPVVQQEEATDQPTTPTNDNEGEDAMTIDQLPPTAHAYLASLYESYVDRGLDVGQIRAELAKAGIRRTPGQTEYDLEHRYGFSGYAARNPAPQVLTYAELDAIEEAKVSKPARLLIRATPGRAVATPYGGELRN